MPACTFFGHGDAPERIRQRLQEAIEELIVEHGVTVFYVGNHGNFDKMAYSALRKAEKEYPQIHYTVVYAYMPKGDETEDYLHTLVPDGIENVFPRWAIEWRNQWMIDRSDFVITYVVRAQGGAAKFAKKAKKQGKKIIEI